MYIDNNASRGNSIFKDEFQTLYLILYRRFSQWNFEAESSCDLNSKIMEIRTNEEDL